MKTGVRTTAPKFFPCIISHIGEMSPNLLVLIEQLVGQYKKRCAKTHYEDGVKMTRRTGDFRRRIKDALMATNARGFGRVIADAGGRWNGATSVLLSHWDYVPTWEVDSSGFG